MMEKEKKVIRLENMGVYGVIRQAEVDDNLIPKEAVVEAVNVNFDRKGAVQKRNGLTKFGNAAVFKAGTGTTSRAYCYGLCNVVFSTSSSYFPLAVFTQSGSQSIYVYQSGSWGITLSGDSSYKPTRFLNFNNNLIRVNGANDMLVWTGGGTWIASGGQINPDNMASYDTNLLEAYKSKVYTAGDANHPNRLYFSSVISSTGAIDWTPTEDYIDINPSDGDIITALKRYGTELLVFKTRYIYRFKSSGIDPDPLISVGVENPEDIIEGKSGLYFLDKANQAVFKYNGGTPEEISRPISDLLTGLYLKNGVGTCWKDNDHIYWSLGSQTINGKTITGFTIRYTESSNIWTTYSYPFGASRTTDYWNEDSWNSKTVLIGTSAINTVYIYSTSTTANIDPEKPIAPNGEIPISYHFITKWYDFGSIEDRKVIKRMVGVCEKAQGSKIYYQKDDDVGWTEMGQLRKYMTDFDQLNIRFHRIRFKINGVSDKDTFIFKGFQITDYDNEGPIVD
jgi:hypothetical protein